MTAVKACEDCGKPYAGLDDRWQYVNRRRTLTLCCEACFVAWQDGESAQ